MSNLGNQSICVDVKKQGTILGAFKKLTEKPKNLETDAKPTQTIEDKQLVVGDKNNNREAVNLVHLHVVQNADEMNKADKSPEAATGLNKEPPNNIMLLKEGEENTIKELKLNLVVEKLCDIPSAKLTQVTNDTSIFTNQANKLPEVTNVTVNDIYVTAMSPKGEPEGRRNRSGLVRSNKKHARKRRASRTGKVTLYSCPICSREISCGSLNEFNEHVDECLEGKSNVSDSKGSDVCQIKDADQVTHLRDIPNLFPVREPAKLLPEVAGLKDIPELFPAGEHVELLPEVTSLKDIPTLDVQEHAKLLQGDTDATEMDCVSDVSSTDEKFTKCDAEKSKECDTEKSRECDTELSKECDTEIEPCHMKTGSDSVLLDSDHELGCDTEICCENNVTEENDKPICDKVSTECRILTDNITSFTSLHGDTDACSVHNDPYHGIEGRIISTDSGLKVVPYENNSEGINTSKLVIKGEVTGNQQNRKSLLENGERNNRSKNSSSENEEINPSNASLSEKEGIKRTEKSLSEIEVNNQSSKMLSESEVTGCCKKSLFLKEEDVTLEKTHIAPPLPVLSENCEIDSNEIENTKSSFLKTRNEQIVVAQHLKDSNVSRVTVCKGDRNEPLDFMKGGCNETKDINSNHDIFVRNSNIHDQPSEISKPTSEDLSVVHELPLDNRQPAASCSWMADDGHVHHDTVATTPAVNDDGVTTTSHATTADAEVGLLVCPVCNVEQRSVDLNAFNSHVDSCLSRGAISEILKEQRQMNPKTLKREREVAKTPVSGQASKKRKTFMPNKSPSCKSILSFFKDPHSF